jgi:hypothetical protein
MPGFNIGGAGGAGDVPPANIETRRKHRWVFRTLEPLEPEVLLVLKTAQRPKFVYTEAEMHHDQEVAWFAGKQAWEPIELTWYDAEQKPEVSGALWDWVNGVTNMADITVSIPQEYKKQAMLAMTKGDGSDSEQWTLYNCWPRETNWEELDYTSSDIQTLSVTMRYDRAKREAAT